MPKTEQNTPMNAIDRLGLRVSAMIQGPMAQLNRRVKIFQLDTDPDYAWQAILELLQETDGLKLERHEDGTVTVSWDAATDGDARIEGEEGDLMRVEVNSAVAPF
ncbi:DUF1654 domain-containing protein [Pseudomonas sp. LMG 31766]|uniref:DUF1654 domain-containing protein n=1 Tax=Pseudomonas chaetocerotis TaxID=2758695 RepID=A0A931D3X2_9PSED|nr:DUF1654 domain-containing protein [Pseudomonas chaetocerotis]MBZ9665772.1 DUF1654 domain-containing protein [Pseudomonas chaetocerotis]